jgi:hypothetical protein
VKYLLSAIASLVVLAFPASAGAAFELGSAEPGYVTAGSDSERTQLFDATERLGAAVVRFNAVWLRIAPKNPSVDFDARNPADPEYDWADLDAAVRAAAARGLQPVITLQKAPEWAEGPDKPTTPQELADVDLEELTDGVWKPDPADFADFAHAVAERYDGDFPDPMQPGKMLPEVRYYQAWNEGNLIRFLGPQYEGGEATSVERYRELLNTAYDELKAVDPNNKVVLAGTAPLQSLVPVRYGTSKFVRDLFCLNGRLKPLPCPEKAKFDIFDHHAIAPRNPGNPGKTDAVRIVDYHELTEMLRAAEKANTIEPGNIKRPLWATEIYWETNPPDTKHGVPPKKAATWTQEGLKLLYEQDVEVVLYFFMRDLDYQGPGLLGNVQGGLLFENLQPKPSYTAFAFPFTAERVNRRKVELFVRAPVSGKLKVQVEKRVKRKGKGKKKGKRKKGKRKRRRAKKTWKTLLKKRVKAGQVLLKKTKLKKKRKKYKLRAKLPGRQSLVYKVR